MFSEYAPFMTKYFYHILIIVISFVLYDKFFGWSYKRIATSKTRTFAASDESTDPSESNVIVDTCTPYVIVERNIILFAILENESRMKVA